MIDIDDFERRALQCLGRFWMTLRADDVLAFVSEIRRLQSILSDYNGTEKEQLMARVEKLERENRALGKMLGERKGHRKCKCGATPEYCHDKYDGEMVHWIVCNKCCAQSGFYRCECCAWAAWDGVE